LGTLLTGLNAHFSQISRISGRLLILEHYSEDAARWQEERAPSTPYVRAQDPAKSLRWSRLGAVYVDFWIDGRHWEAWAARLINSGYPQLSLPGIGEGEEPGAGEPAFPWTPHAVYEYCDQALELRYQPSLHRATIRTPTEERLWTGVRGQVYRVLLEACPPPYGRFIAHDPEDRKRAAVARVHGGLDAPMQVYQISYRTGEEMGCRATYWVECRGTDFGLVKYDDYWLRHDRVGYRRIGEVREVVELENGARLPSEVVLWRFKYLDGEERAWHSTVLTIVLEARVHDGKRPARRPWDWLLPGTYISDPAHHAPGHHGSHYLAGNVGELRRLVLSRLTTPPGFDPRMDAAPDDAATQAHGGPCELDVRPPRVREGLYDWGPSASAAAR
jgi:hypothetical protein